MSRHRPTTTPLAKILPRLLENLRSEGRPSREQIQQVWERLVGREAAQHSRPARLTGRRLLVEVENSGWLYTLNQKRGWLLQGLIELLGAARVRRLSLRIGELQGNA